MGKSELRKAGDCCIWLLLFSALAILFMFGGLPWEKGRSIPPKPRPLPTDDLLEDKHPEFITELTHEASLVSRLVFFNSSTSVISLDMAGLVDNENSLEDRVFPSFNAALGAAGKTAGRGADYLPSIDMLDAYTKFTDDSIISTLEQLLHDKDGIFPGGKQGFLYELLGELQASPAAEGKDEAVSFIAAALELGGNEVSLPASANKLQSSELKWFNSQPILSKPTGVYTQDVVLQQVFKRDRLLQQPFFAAGSAGSDSAGYIRSSLQPAIRIAEVLAARPDLLTAYSKYQAIAEGVTNPSSNFELVDLLEHTALFGNERVLWQALLGSGSAQRIAASGNTNSQTLGVAFWPFKSAKENALFEKLYGGNPNLPGGSTMDALADAIESGQVDLTPTAESGWYDYQQFALETLLLPQKAQENDKLLLMGSYKKRLRKAFEAMVTQRRETHIKSVMLIKVKGKAEQHPRPTLHAEPSATHYLRTARAYRMLAETLGGLLGEPEETNQESELNLLSQTVCEAMANFYGLYLVVCNDLGMRPELDTPDWEAIAYCVEQLGLQMPPVQADYSIYGSRGLFFALALLPELNDSKKQQAYALWKYSLGELGGLSSSEAGKNDVRVITPVLQNAGGDKARYWTVLGVQLKRVKLEYAVPPRVVSHYEIEPQGDLQAAQEYLANDENLSDIEWEASTRLLPVYVFAELTLGANPPTREEFQAICDRGSTKDEIVALLTAEFGSGGFHFAGNMLARYKWIAPIVLVLLAAMIAVFLIKKRRSS